MSFLGSVVGAVANVGCYLTSITAENPFEVFSDNTKGGGIFDSAIRAVTPFFKDAYLALIIGGICAMVLAGMGAIVVLALSKNDKKVADNKTWLLRIIGCVFGLGFFVAAVSLVWRVSTDVNKGINDQSGNPASTPVAQIREIPYHEVDELF